MIVISDTTPIISLMKVNKLLLLQQLYENVLVPKAVYREFAVNLAYTRKAEMIKMITCCKM